MAKENVKEVEELYTRFSRGGIFKRRFRKLVHSFTWLFIIQFLSGIKRVVDFIIAFVLLLVFSPAMLIFVILKAKPVLQKIPRSGKWSQTFYEYNFVMPKNFLGKFLQKIRFDRFPVLLNILKGDMAFVGPRLVSPEDIPSQEKVARRRFSVRPGLICLWWIRKRANIAYSSEMETDAEYVDNHSFLNDVGIALRAIPAVLYGEGVKISHNTINLFGIDINNITMDETLETIISWGKGEKFKQICFVNPDCGNIAYRNDQYYKVLQKSDLVLADGIGVKIAGKILGNEIKQNVNGTDLFPMLCSLLETHTELGMFLLGARPGVAELVAQWVEQNHPKAKISGWHHGYFSEEELPKVIDIIKASQANILLVAFGAPRQDCWISENLQKLEVEVAMGVGGLFDFYSGRIPRAPQWMREIGMEWLFRLLQEPKRLWKRYVIGNGVFLYRVMKQKFLGKIR